MKTVILAGGTGTRLWPLSRKKSPKQFHNLISDESLLLETIKRLSFQKPEDIYIATTKNYLDQVKVQTANLVPTENLIIEPALMDTAPCIGLIATILHHRHPNSVMSIIYADHLIQNQEELIKTLKIADQLAREQNTFNIIEVKANFPSVNLGYVKVGKPIQNIDDVTIYAFEKFVEKPNLETAKKLLKYHECFWNTGLYVWQTSAILEQFQKHQPQTWKILQKINEYIDKPNFSEQLEQLYPQTKRISIDYGIMEKIDPEQVRIIPANLGWSDIGTWEGLWNEISSNQINNGNVIKGEHLELNSSNNLIYGQSGKMIATIGLKDLVIIDTPDALLVCPKNKSYLLKDLLGKIKEKRPDLL